MPMFGAPKGAKANSRAKKVTGLKSGSARVTRGSSKVARRSGGTPNAQQPSVRRG